MILAVVVKVFVLTSVALGVANVIVTDWLALDVAEFLLLWLKLNVVEFLLTVCFCEAVADAVR